MTLCRDIMSWPTQQGEVAQYEPSGHPIEGRARATQRKVGRLIEEE